MNLNLNTKDVDEVIIKFLPSTHLENASQLACSLSAVLGKTVRFRFNGIELVAEPKTLASELIAKYDTMIAEKRLRDTMEE